MKTRTKKTKTVSNNENTNATAVQNIKKSILKTNHFKDISNSFNMKENNNSKKSKIVLMDCSVNLKDAMKIQVKHHEPEKKTSEVLDQTKPNQNPSFEVHKQMFFKSKRNKKTKRVSLHENSNENVQTQTQSNRIDIKVISEKDSKNEYKSKKSKNRNKKMKTVGPKVEQSTEETNVENLSNLSDNNEGILTENSIPEVVNADQTSMKHNMNATVRMNRRPSCIIHAYYQGSPNSDCQHKRKLSNVEKVVNNFLKRFKPSHE